MISKEIQIENKVGLYAKPATQFTQCATSFRSDIYVQRNEKRANAKSLLGILSLAICCGTTITLTAEGPDEKAAIGALEALLTKELDENSSTVFA
jgi:phosphotransferase system HPr (HPr) family protein